MSKIRNAAAILVFSVIGGLPAVADTLPAYCGAVGAKSYKPPVVAIPGVVLNRGTVITVTNATVVVNGDTSSVEALVANPGPDGISIQEAIDATNNDPGTWNIQFAPALKGSTIVVDTPPSQGLSPLSGGNVTINGDIDGDGQPDITLTSASGTTAVLIQSGGNTINGLALQNCGSEGCVFLVTPNAAPVDGHPGLPVTGKTFANITISNLVMTNISAQGGGIFICPSCGGTPPASPTGNVWDHVLITGNTITGGAVGAVGIQVLNGWGSTLQHTTIANNNISLAAQDTTGINLITANGSGPLEQGDTVLDTRIVNNTIAAASGMQFRGDAVGSLNDGTQVIGNQISASGLIPGASAIGFLASDNETGVGTDVAGPASNDVIRNVAILANTIQIPGVGIVIQGGQNSSSNNAVSNVSILGNTILNLQPASPGPTTGIYLLAGGSFGSAVVGTGNSLNNILIQANSIQSQVPPGNINFGGGNPIYAINSAGISVYAGATAQENSINGLAIANNDVNTPNIGIALTGGVDQGGSPQDGAPDFSADNNLIAGAQIFCNQVDQIPTNGVLPSSGIQGINAISGLDHASGNQVQQIYVADNLVAGTLGGLSTFSYLGSGGSGNTLTTASGPTPAISLVANAEGGSPTIAPNTWIAINGVELAPQQDALNVRTWGTADFVNNQMPTQLDGVSVTVNGKSAYVYYVNPSQVNVLTTPDAIEGTVNVVVSNNGVSSQTYTAQAQALSPSFFVFDGTHIVATHADGTDVGPATLYPGLTTPASPGETIVIYANGFGPTSVPVVSGAVTQSGTLSPLPVITIGGIQANVRFAGLNITPGEFQFDVDVPMNLAPGDQPIIATYNGVTTQGGAVLTVGP